LPSHLDGSGRKLAQAVIVLAVFVMIAVIDVVVVVVVVKAIGWRWCVLLELA
jgi:UPF0716 family protein affecting phage T7 exclusion